MHAVVHKEWSAPERATATTTGIRQDHVRFPGVARRVPVPSAPPPSTTSEPARCMMHEPVVLSGALSPHIPRTATLNAVRGNGESGA
jgi:hypothetical protein